MLQNPQFKCDRGKVSTVALRKAEEREESETVFIISEQDELSITARVKAPHAS